MMMFAPLCDGGGGAPGANTRHLIIIPTTLLTCTVSIE
jgi:hypothetical protein